MKSNVLNASRSDCLLVSTFGDRHTRECVLLGMETHLEVVSLLAKLAGQRWVSVGARSKLVNYLRHRTDHTGGGAASTRTNSSK